MSHVRTWSKCGKPKRFLNWKRLGFFFGGEGGEVPYFFYQQQLIVIYKITGNVIFYKNRFCEM